MSLFKKSKFIIFILFSGIMGGQISYAEQPQNSTTTKTEAVVAKVNINTASAEELAQHLNGVGLNKAKRIVEYREKFGPFVSIEQLKEVTGIGQSILDKNSAKLTL
ncbi:ComEA family DNA-binding protein [Orbaceae bacterium ac157xtp]